MNLHKNQTMAKVVPVVISVFLDICLCFLACFAAGFLSSDNLSAWISFLLSFSSILSFLLILVFLIFRFYFFSFWGLGIREWCELFVSSFVVSAFAFGITYLLPTSFSLHFSPVAAVLSTLSFSFSLASYRLLPKVFTLLESKNKKIQVTRKRTLIVGAGSAGQIALEDSKTNINSRIFVVGFLDDDPRKIGKYVAGVKVLGPISALKKQVEACRADEVIIAIQQISKSQLQSIIQLVKDCNVQVCRFPILSELNGVNRRSILSVDINDILGREPIVLDNSGIFGMLAGKTVLITGAGGSIGSELARQIYQTKPQTLVLFDIYENGVYSIQQELLRDMKKEGETKVKLVTLIGSTYNETRVEQVIKNYRPDYIYHAAAYKHVPLMEESPAEAVRSNVIGTYYVAKMADKYHVKKMLLISTDKAVRPTNAMGATKRFAEMIIQYFSSISKNTKYCAVRFGNVLGSNGSVIPLFTKQIEDGGPVTITDPRIIRFFMTIPEAVGLVLQSSLFAEGGEIFILDMGKPIKIQTLAEKMIRQAGFIPGEEIKIVYTGLRPGEKLYEETLIDPKKQIKTSSNRIYIEEKSEVQPIEKEVSFISSVFGLDVSSNSVKEAIKEVVTSYSPEMDD